MQMWILQLNESKCTVGKMESLQRKVRMDRNIFCANAFSIYYHEKSALSFGWLILLGIRVDGYVLVSQAHNDMTAGRRSFRSDLVEVEVLFCPIFELKTW